MENSPAFQSWRQTLAQTGCFTGGDLLELEDHVRNDAEENLKTGLGQEEAVNLALERLGNPADLARAYRRSNRHLIWWERVQLLLLGLLSSAGAWLLAVAIFQAAAVGMWLLGWPPQTLSLGLTIITPLILLSLASGIGFLVLHPPMAWQGLTTAITRLKGLLKVAPVIVIGGFLCLRQFILSGGGKWIESMLRPIQGISNYRGLFDLLAAAIPLLLAVAMAIALLREQKMPHTPGAVALWQGRLTAFFCGTLSLYVLGREEYYLFVVLFALLASGLFILPYTLLYSVRKDRFIEAT